MIHPVFFRISKLVPCLPFLSSEFSTTFYILLRTTFDKLFNKLDKLPKAQHLHLLCALIKSKTGKGVCFAY